MTNTQSQRGDSPQSATTQAKAEPPAHTRVYLDLRDRILFGDLAPGEAVTIQGLSASMGSGITPVRETIRRLTSEGALVFQGNRRVSVPILTAKDVQDLAFIRTTVESELTRRAASRADDDQIAALTQIDADLDAAISIGDIRGYLQGNYRFHMTLYAMAEAPILSEVTDRLWLRFGPSLRVVCGRLGTQNLPDWHKEILDALHTRNQAAAAEALTRDLEQGMQQVLAALGEHAGTTDSIDTK